MMRNIFRSLTIALAVVLLVSALGFAGGRDRVGTSSAAQLLIPVGSRYMAMGGAGTAVATGVEAIYWNPAGVARSTNAANAMLSHMTYLADISVNTIGVEANFGGLGHLGFALKTIGIGDIEVTTADNPDGTGQIFSPVFFTLTTTWARQLTDRVAFGVNLNLVREEMQRVGATSFAVDAGVEYTDFGGVQGLDFGVAIKNIGPSMKYDGTALLQQGTIRNSNRGSASVKLNPASFELPSIIELGLAYNYNMGEAGKLTATTMFQNNNFSADDVKLGLEYGFNNMFFLRGGYTMGIEVPSEWDYLYGPTFGAGFHYGFSGLDLTVDYAYRTVDLFDSNNMFTLKFGF